MSDLDVKLTCDMSDVEFVGYVRERCHLTIANTAAGVYLSGVCNRLLERSVELSKANSRIAALEAENAELMEHMAKRDVGNEKVINDLMVQCEQLKEQANHYDTRIEELENQVMMYRNRERNLAARDKVLRDAVDEWIGDDDDEVSE